MASARDQRIEVPIDDPNADTECHGIIPQKPPSPTPLIEEAILEGRRLAHENRLAGKELDELDELEDLEDEKLLAEYREKRIAEIRDLQKKACHGSVYPISKPDYQREVTDASKNGFVLVNLTSSNTESRVLSELWREAAREYSDIKFCEIRANQAIENYPDRNCPTILVYHNGDLTHQIVTLATLGGCCMGLQSLDKLLLKVGAVSDTDLRVIRRRRPDETLEEESQKGGIRSGRMEHSKALEDDDEEWD